MGVYTPHPCVYGTYRTTQSSALGDLLKNKDKHETAFVFGDKMVRYTMPSLLGICLEYWHANMRTREEYQKGEAVLPAELREQLSGDNRRYCVSVECENRFFPGNHKVEWAYTVRYKGECMTEELGCQLEDIEAMLSPIILPFCCTECAQREGFP